MSRACHPPDEPFFGRAGSPSAPPSRAVYPGQWSATEVREESGQTVELRTSGGYAVTVRAGDRSEAAEGANEETVEVPESWFDCNDSAMEAVIREGEIEKTGITTDEGCSTF